MSHSHERADKTCLNCGAHVTGRFCHDCGQENLEPKESFPHLVAHFFEDLTHFDGKFFSSIKFLFTKPGFLTEEYIKGKRASYLNPIRMYLFISAMFFLVYMTFFVGHSNHVKIKDEKKSSAAKNRSGEANEVLDSLKNAGIITTTRSADSNKQVIDLPGGEKLIIDTADKNNESWYMPLHTYDSLQKALPKDKKDGTIKHYYKRKAIAALEMSRARPDEVGNKFSAKFYHSLPYMFFICLPLLALILRLLYIRRKEFFFVSHVIFMVHYFCTVFLLWLLFEIAGELGKPGKIMALLITLGYLIYLYKGMRRFYKQGRFKTILKFFLFLCLGGTLVGMITLLFVINSFLNIGA